MIHIDADHELIRYTGRIGFEDPKQPLFTWVCSSLRFMLKGNKCVLKIDNKRLYWKSILGLIVNGAEMRLDLQDGMQEIDISRHLIDDVNDVLVYKRQDSCHNFSFAGMEIEGELMPLPERPARRMEVYGDSVSAGEVCEAMHCVGQSDPQGHDGIFSNSWYCYGWQTARALGAELHDIAQGGIALHDKRGWFNAPDYIGMQSCWDKVNYNPNLGPVTDWEFAKYVPHVVVVALGQNDANPDNYMKNDPEGDKAREWKRDYTDFIRGLRAKYPKATILLAMTVLGHDKEWDDAIEDVCNGLQDARVHHFLYHRNGRATPGHPRMSEHTEMARELTAYIRGLGDAIWE